MKVLFNLFYKKKKKNKKKKNKKQQQQQQHKHTQEESDLGTQSCRRESTLLFFLSFSAVHTV